MVAEWEAGDTHPPLNCTVLALKYSSHARDAAQILGERFKREPKASVSN